VQRIKLGLGDEELNKLIKETRPQAERELDTSKQPAISGPLHLAGVPFVQPGTQPATQNSDGLDDLRAAAAGIDVNQILGGAPPNPDGLDDLRAAAADIDVKQIPG
jgi:hypothetical protein